MWSKSSVTLFDFCRPPVDDAGLWDPGSHWLSPLAAVGGEGCWTGTELNLDKWSKDNLSSWSCWEQGNLGMERKG